MSTVPRNFIQNICIIWFVFFPIFSIAITWLDANAFVLVPVTNLKGKFRHAQNNTAASQMLSCSHFQYHFKIDFIYIDEQARWCFWCHYISSNALFLVYLIIYKIRWISIRVWFTVPPAAKTAATHHATESLMPGQRIVIYNFKIEMPDATDSSRRLMLMNKSHIFVKYRHYLCAPPPAYFKCSLTRCGIALGCRQI